MNTIELAYSRYSKKRFPLPTNTQVTTLEDRIGVEFPWDYRRFLLEFNGGYFVAPQIASDCEGCPEDALKYLSGIGASHPYAELGAPHTLAFFDDNDPPQIVPIGYTEMSGLILLDTAPGDERGNIYLKEAFGRSYWLADSIEEFFTLLREPLPTDEQT